MMSVYCSVQSTTGSPSVERAPRDPGATFGPIALSAEAAGQIRGWVEAVDSSDPRTAFHSRRVTSLSLQLGRAAGFGYDELRKLELAALLHDVGKLRVPLEILRKPGRLDEREWVVVR